MTKAIAALTVLMSLNAFAAEAPVKMILECSGGGIEGAGVNIVEGRLEGSLSWDCFSGGAICEARSWLVQGRNAEGDIVFQGETFSLTLYSESGKGTYRGNLKAVDHVDSASEGGGLTYDQPVECTMD